MARGPRSGTREPGQPVGVPGNGDWVSEGNTDGTVGPDFSVDPGAIGTSGNGNADGNANGDGARGTRKRRSDAGRKRGPRSASKTALDLGTWTSIILTAHAGLASAINVPMLAISHDEAERLAKAIANVAELYDLPVLSPEAQAWANLVVAAGSIYGPRVLAATMTKKTAAQPAPENVIRMNPIPGINS
jgi:hypothetical protein